MKVFHSPDAAINRVQVGETLYFRNSGPKGAQFLPATCPHRGGPLHLGKASGDGQDIVCPWHDIPYKTCRLERKALVSVRVGNQLSFIVPHAVPVETWQVL
ncbi:Rieske 2Fe-2S domain-containing protein [Pseudomonas sp. GD03858]|uniref:Rieske 2Fe-2S domain-containing protein n=1 Tax=unclassified Pseudomonas TaxID=196821 RepID=UPI00244AC0B7|nr:MULTISPECIES: Rieske 2Fe-2S domain-containing protein [unclassified Pseudomonas]MDH0646518.1 Rieske 2Fe-2S domain-containing protein [Pseudomonas sp. GD03867]MDH0663657.1 Rieske 2Fe-2S domain-containing protein [Pseudomonas sp. GD03858]